ncbi:MAG TPA: ATP-binding protein, partial [Labilithrix sp.]|nr:ATP-binding protein [Labilithrix sp.]
VAFVARDGRVVDASPAFVEALGAGAVGGAGSTAALSHLSELPADLGRALLAHVVAALDGPRGVLDVEMPAGATDERWHAHVVATPRAAGIEAMAVIVVERADPSSDRAAERRRSEHALRESEHRFRQIADTIKDVFFITDQRAFKLLYVNPAFEEVYGRSRESVYDDLSSLIESIHPDDRARVLGVFNASMGVGHDTTYRIVRPDGSIVWAHDRGFPVSTADGAMTLTSGLVTDITAELRLRDELLHAQKLESIGRLAGGLAHDFNNVLTVVLTCADIAKSLLPDSSPAQEELGYVLEAGERAAALTRQLLAFARRQVIQPTVIDLSDLAGTMREMLGRLLGEGITLEMRLEPRDRATVWADRSQLEQVVLNLAANARDAMPGGGRLLIDVGVVHGSAPTDVPQGDYVRLAVEDEGEGIAPAHLDHIFEPFFTTEGRGGGLGLATSHAIVAQAGGQIRVRSGVARGAAFEVLLPHAARAHDAGPSPARASKSVRPPGQETILLVEDQAPVRKAAATILRGRGYRVIEASDGVDALQVASEHPDAIQLLLTDVVMPR